MLKESTACPFNQYQAAKSLSELAENPIDLACKGALPIQRLEEFVAESAGYKLLYGTERVSQQVLESLEQLAQESKSLLQMQAMQSGEVVNYIEGYPSEQRPALHTATRDFFDSPQQESSAVKAKEQALVEAEKLRAFIKQIDQEDQFSHMVVIGIGGSYLGPEAIYQALKYLTQKERTISFIHNIDPDNAVDLLKNLDLEKTLVVVISKTGTTLETVTNEAVVREWFERAGLKGEKHFIAITGEGSEMERSGHYLAVFHIWDWIGGRFSSSSAIGGVLLSFAYGFEVYWEFLKGAHAMDRAALNSQLQCNLPLLAALLSIWNRNFLGIETLALIPYSYALSRFLAHIQQLVMESNGKRVDKQGRAVSFQTSPIIWGEPGTDGQHSFFQLLHQGTNLVALELIGFKESCYRKDWTIQGTTSQEKLLANLFAQSIALATGEPNENPNRVFLGNRPNHILLGKELTPYSLGALLSFYENKTAFEGFILGINSFDQEGVSLGKRAANRIIDSFAEYRKSKKLSGNYPEGEAFLSHLERL